MNVVMIQNYFYFDTKPAGGVILLNFSIVKLSFRISLYTNNNLVALDINPFLINLVNL